MWSIGCVRTGGEISLAERLSQSGASTYLPLGARHVRRARKRCKATIQAPAFPGYIFIEEPVTDRIYEEPGFYDFIRLEGQRYLLKDESIAELRAMEGGKVDKNAARLEKLQRVIDSAPNRYEEIYAKIFEMDPALAKKLKKPK